MAQKKIIPPKINQTPENNNAGDFGAGMMTVSSPLRKEALLLADEGVTAGIVRETESGSVHKTKIAEGRGGQEIGGQQKSPKDATASFELW